MDILTMRVATLSKKPQFGTDEYKKWVEQSDFVQFLQAVPGLDEMILYASAAHAFLHGVMVPTRLVTPPNTNDLDRWNCTPLSSWGITITGGRRSKVFLSPPLDHTGSTTLDRGEQIVFARSFDGRQEQKSYIEISPRLIQPFGLHYVPERSAYCRFDNQGDVENVIQITEIPSDNPNEHGQIVTIERDLLYEYMTMTDQSLVLLFDSTRFEPKCFGVWQNQDVEHRTANPEIWYHMGHCIGIASYVRGFQIVRSALSKKDLLKRHGFSHASDRQYITFIAHDWKHDIIRECSCDPKRLGNYFVESDLPYEMSPVFFRPEVLLKYKADSDKYQVQDRSITCRNAWHLQTYDVNDVGQIHTYLKHLSYLPYDEQLYWKSFNEQPKGPISRRALHTDFEGRCDLQYDPLRSLTQILRELHEARVAWWKLRDATLRVHYPVTKSADEWAKEIHALDKLLVEGFETHPLRARATLLGRIVEQDWKSLKLLQEVLRGLGTDEAQVQKVVGPLQEVHVLRSKISGHASGVEARQIKAAILKEHKTYTAQFRQLCARCDAAARSLRTILEPMS
ncbi:MAG: hypothetical protein ACREJN_17050 [Nitrospiraceae bacterium]